MANKKLRQFVQCQEDKVSRDNMPHAATIWHLTFKVISYIIGDNTNNNRCNMAKDERLKLYEREHFDKKVSKKLEPLIEREELRIKATVQDILNKGTKTFAKNIGADKVINALQDAEDKLKRASRNAYIFFEQSAKKDVAWDKLKDYKFDRDDRDHITVKNCQDQLDKWAEAQAKQLAEKSPQGKNLAYIKAIKERAEDMVKEASIPSELIQELSGLLRLLPNGGVEWNVKLPALPPPKGK